MNGEKASARRELERAPKLRADFEEPTMRGGSCSPSNDAPGRLEAMFQTLTSMRVGALVLLGLMWCGATAHAQVPFVPTPPAPGAKVLWGHEGGAERYELLIDGVPVDTRWQADVPEHGYSLPLPTLLPGLRTIMVSACNGDACAYSDLLVVIAVPGPIRMAPAMVQTPILPPQ